MPDKIKKKSHFNLTLTFTLNFLFALASLYVFSFIMHLYVYEADKDHFERVTQITHRLEIEFFQNRTHLLGRVIGKSSHHLKEALRVNKQTQSSLKLLNSIKSELSAAIVYLINPKGDVISSTSFGEGETLIGDNYFFREYFIEAMKGASYTFTALGIATKKRGIYYSSPVSDEDGKAIGVIVIKLDAEAIDQNLSQISESVYLVDSRNFVFASNRTNAILKPLSKVVKEDLDFSLAVGPPKESLFSFNLLAPTRGFNFTQDGDGRSLYRAGMISMGDNNWWVLAVDDGRHFMPVALLIIFSLGIMSLFTLLNVMLISYFSVRRSNERALNANKAKTEFLANMSHEIRTPISGIIGLTDLMLSEQKLTPELSKNLKTVQRLGEHLSTIINDILDYSKIEVGKYVLNPEYFQLGEFLEQFLVPFSLEARKKGIEVEHKVAANVPGIVYLDQKRLHQILINIVGNALKFTSKGVVSLSISKVIDRNVLVFSVKDTGIGIKENEDVDLFTPFTQADASTSKVYGGTGLGLTISKKLCELMGGSITYTSKASLGTEFRIEIPYDPDQFSSKKMVDRKPIEENVNIAGLKVLVVDDNEINLQVAKAVVAKFGPKKILTCSNGAEAIALFQAESPELILMDCQMPVMSGFEAATKIREIEGRREDRPVVIVALTANVMNGDKEECLKAGMDDYLPKPLRKDELGQVLLKHLNIQKE